MGALLHLLVIAPLLTAPPINQLLATGGVLFVLQSFATVAFGIDFRNLGIRMPVLKFAEMHFSYSRLLAFAAALIGMTLVYYFMKKTYVGTAIRAISQDRQIMALMGVDTRRIYLITSALGGALAGLASCLLVLQYDIHPFVGLSFGPITFLICRAGRTRAISSAASSRRSCSPRSSRSADCSPISNGATCWPSPSSSS